MAAKTLTVGADVSSIVDGTETSLQIPVRWISIHSHIHFDAMSVCVLYSLAGRQQSESKKDLAALHSELVLVEVWINEGHIGDAVRDVDDLLARRAVDILEHVRDLKGPILLHVKTVKGKGYPYSESDPERWHSGADFTVETGEKKEHLI